MKKQLDALCATRDFLEERYVAALDDDDPDLAGAYRNVLLRLVSAHIGNAKPSDLLDLFGALLQSHGVRRQ